MFFGSGVSILAFIIFLFFLIARLNRRRGSTVTAVDTVHTCCDGNRWTPVAARVTPPGARGLLELGTTEARADLAAVSTEEPPTRVCWNRPIDSFRAASRNGWGRENLQSDSC